MMQATFAAGCFWGVELTFSKLPGVLETRVGYTGGTQANPTYQQVCTGNTGHAEAVQIDFNPDKISYIELMDTFWQCHNPTTRDRQGPDIGSQYRSVIFFHDAQQQQWAETAKQQLQTLHPDQTIVTEIVPLTAFYLAEDYHQHYLFK